MLSWWISGFLAAEAGPPPLPPPLLFQHTPCLELTPRSSAQTTAVGARRGRRGCDEPTCTSTPAATARFRVTPCFPLPGRNSSSQRSTTTTWQVPAAGVAWTAGERGGVPQFLDVLRLSSLLIFAHLFDLSRVPNGRVGRGPVGV